MQIKGIEGMTGEDLERELRNGGRFVMFTYTVSILILTFRRPSNIYFLKAGHGAFLKGLPYLLISLVFGWWGIPWGPIYTAGSVGTALSGGKNVTDEVLASL
jgi:hypothetical protein